MMHVGRIIELLKANVLFGGFDDLSLDRIAQRSRFVEFAAGTTVFKRGTRLHYLLLVAEGELVAVGQMLWGDMELDRILPGEIVGEMSMVTGNDIAGADVRTRTDAVCIEMDREILREFWNTDDKLARQILGVVLDRETNHRSKLDREIDAISRAMLFSMAQLAESRDPGTGAHLDRTRNYCAFIAQLLSDHPNYRDTVPAGFVQRMYQLSPLHDIGKVGIPDAILLKPGKLTDAEFETMKHHTLIGAECMATAMEYSDQPILRMARNICLYHHERWDGGGYPESLPAGNIPLEARIVSLADVFDVMVSKRVYKKPISLANARDEIERCAGSQFDPGIADIMIKQFDDFERLHHSQQR